MDGGKGEERWSHDLMSNIDECTLRIRLIVYRTEDNEACGMASHACLGLRVDMIRMSYVF